MGRGPCTTSVSWQILRIMLERNSSRYVSQYWSLEFLICGISLVWYPAVVLNGHQYLPKGCALLRGVYWNPVLPTNHTPCSSPLSITLALVIIYPGSLSSNYDTISFQESWFLACEVSLTSASSNITPINLPSINIQLTKAECFVLAIPSSKQTALHKFLW